MQTQKRLATILALTGSLICSACTTPGPSNAPRPQFVPPPISGPGQTKYLPPPQFVIPPARPEELSAAGLPMPPPIFVPKPTKAKAKIKAKKNPVKFERKKIDGIPFYLTTIDLTDEATYLSILLPHDAPAANDANTTYGAEDFNSYVKAHQGAVLMNGTFFSKDKQQRVMGNVVADGKMLKYSKWENYGTTLAIRAGNKLEMVTARGEGQPEWDKHWFSLTCGPRLLREGKVWLFPQLEGFRDPHVFTIGPRQAIGYPASQDRIYLVTFLLGLSLEKEADLMKKIGCAEAMNLDGGASRALAHNSQIIVKAERPLTNVLIVYDCKNPAPSPVSQSWRDFQKKFGESPLPVYMDLTQPTMPFKKADSESLIEKYQSLHQQTDEKPGR